MGMIRSAVSVAALAVSLGSVAFAAEEGAGMRLDDLETALSVTGWDIVHRTEATDGSIVIGARSHQGWPVIHTLSNCDEGACAVWSQATPLESGLVGKAVSYSGTGLDAFGNALFGDRNATGQLTLRAAMIGVPCDAACQMTKIEEFETASRASFDTLSSGEAATLSAGPHTRVPGWTLAETTLSHAAVPMDHRQIAAIVGATDEEADRMSVRFSVPEAERTRVTTLPAVATSAETISVPPLQPE